MLVDTFINQEHYTLRDTDQQKISNPKNNKMQYQKCLKETCDKEDHKLDFYLSLTVNAPQHKVTNNFKK